MIIVIVEHYLNQEGKLYFPSWIKETEKILLKWSGFNCIKQLKKDNDKTETSLYLEFNSLDELHIWSSSLDHSEILNRLKPFRIKKQDSMIYKVVN